MCDFYMGCISEDVCTFGKLAPSFGVAMVAALKGTEVKRMEEGNLVVGKRFTYRLDRPLAESNLSTLWLANVADKGIDIENDWSPVVLKFPRKPEYVEYLKLEAQRLDELWEKLAKKLPGRSLALVELCEHGYSHYTSDFFCYFMAMRYYDYLSLNMFYGERPVPVAHLAHSFMEIAPTLDAVHALGYLHSDIKLSNILVNSSGRAVLTDFNPHESLRGNVHYAAPELARYYVTGEGREEIGHTIDLYALSVALFRALTGTYPINLDRQGADPYQELHERVNLQKQTICLPTTIKLAPSVTQVLVKGLAQSPQHRYQSATELAKAFRSALQQTSTPRHMPYRLMSLIPKRWRKQFRS